MKTTRNGILSWMLTLTVALSMFPCLSLSVQAEEGTDGTLEKLAAQLQDENTDPFAFRTGTAGLMDETDPFPDTFDLRNADLNGDGTCENYVTPVKFQNPFSTCWGFSAIASAETSILSSGLAEKDGYAARANEELGLKELNLSEKHLAFFLNQIYSEDDPDDPHSQNGEGMVYTGQTGSANIYNTGGVPFYATGLFASGTGPVLEDTNELFEYHGINKTVMKKNNEPYCYSSEDDWWIDNDLKWFQSYVLKESFLLPSPSDNTEEEHTAAIHAIKDQLSNGRAVQIGYYADTSTPNQNFTASNYINLENWAHYSYNQKNSNHGVTIVGWDDHYPREHFAHKTMSGEDAPIPENDGAWLVKNSWGSGEELFPNKGTGDWGLLQGQDHGVYNEETGQYDYIAKENAVHTGYFWLSYEDSSVSMAEALDFDVANALEGYWLYDYDNMPVNDVDSAFLEKSVSMANVFDVAAKGRIEYVCCQTTAPGTKVQYDVYLLNESAATPVDGLLIASTNEEYQYGGFHKAHLDSPAVLEAGQRFSVVVTQHTPDNKYSFSIQTALNKNAIEELKKQYGMELSSYAKGIINKNESLFCVDNEWFDLSDTEIQEKLLGSDGPFYDLDNFPVKAYLADLSEEPDDTGWFNDVSSGDWYYDSVQWVQDQGVMNGVGDHLFDPDGNTTRAMVVTMLWRLEHQPQPAGSASPFIDVEAGSWYEQAVRWAAETGIVKGMTETEFMPESPVTREQLATILFRYATEKGMDVSAGEDFDILIYDDALSISEWAKDAMQWMCAEGILNGRTVSTLAPDGTATRAEIATMFMRFSRIFDR